MNAEPETNTCEKCGGDGCSDDYHCHDGIRRSRGREFVGSDGDTAGALVESVRENHVAQAAGRYARDADDPTDTAVVFARTAATPTNFADYQVAGVERVAGDKQRAVAETARENPGATAREVKRATDDRLGDGETVSKRHVAETLVDLLERGVIQRRQAAGAFGGDEWDAGSATDADLSGEGDVVPEAITNSPVWGASTWEFVVADVHAPEPSSSTAGADAPSASAPADRSDPPPDTPD